MSRPRSLWRVLWRLTLVLAVLAGGGELAWQRYRQPVRAAVRDYLALRRVEKHHDALLVAAHESELDPCLLAGLMVAESGGRVDARSSAGALGLFQLSIVSARWRAQILGLAEPTEEQLLSDPELSARLGADNLAWLLDTYDGNLERALCAYNTGARRLKQLTDEAGGWQAWRAEREAAGDSRLLAYANRVLRMREEVHASGLFGDSHFSPAAAGHPGELQVGGEEQVGTGPESPEGVSESAR